MRRSGQFITFEWNLEDNSAHFSEEWGTLLGQPIYVPDVARFVRHAECLAEEDRTAASLHGEGAGESAVPTGGDPGPG